MTAGRNQVVILGAGVVGLSAAYYALKSGFAVKVLDRGDAQTWNCSFGNAGLVCPSHFIPLAAPGMVAQALKWMLNSESPFYVRPRLSFDLAQWGWHFYKSATHKHVVATQELFRDLLLESRRLFIELQQEEDFGLQQRGLMMLCKTQHALDEEAKCAEVANRLGITAQVLDGKRVAELDPEISMDILGGVYFPLDCHLESSRFMTSLRNRVLALGGTIEDHVEVVGIARSGSTVKSVVAANGRIFDASHFVLACGSWLPALLRKLGFKLLLQAGKGYSLTLKDPVQLPKIPSICCEARLAVTPMRNALRFSGTMEFDDISLSVNPGRIRGIINAAVRYFPKFSARDFNGVESWAGLRPVSPDGVPYLGKLPKYENVIVAGGHAMLGLTLGPVSGALVATLLRGERTFRSIEQLALNRFSNAL